MKNKLNNKITLDAYLKQQKFPIFLYILFIGLAYALGIYTTVLSANFLAEVSVFSFDAALKILISLIIVGCTIRIFDLFNALIFFKVSGNFTYQLKKDLVKRTLMIKSKSFSDHSTGIFVSRITGDVNELAWKLDSVVDNITTILSSSFIMIYISILSFWVGFCMIGTIILLGIIEIFKNKIYEKHNKQIRKCGEQITALTNELVRSEKDVKSLGLEKALNKKSDEKFDEYKKKYFKQYNTNAYFWNGRNFLIAILTNVIALLGMIYLENKIISLAIFLFIWSNRSIIREFVWCFGNMFETFTEIKVCKNRIFEIFDEKDYEIEKFGNVELKNFKGNITFNKVKFSYDEELDLNKAKENENIKKSKNKTSIARTKKTIFNNLNFKIKANTTVAFVGESGSGKSTILNLIAKLYEVDSGEVLFDETNINDLTKESLRSNVSLVNQFPYIFDESIKNNLLMANPDATEKQIIKACKDADFWNFVCEQKNGLETKVGESGIKLSGGQKQRLAIARALLRKTRIIIFDESTSSLDNFSQQVVKKNIEKLSGKSTIIIVAHRLSTIDNADVIYFLDKSKIASKGTFKELFENNKKFKKMYQSEQ